MGNIDTRTVDGFGEEWSAFTQDQLTDEQAQDMFDKYFSLFDWNSLPKGAEGFSMTQKGHSAFSRLLPSANARGVSGTSLPRQKADMASVSQ